MGVFRYVMRWIFIDVVCWLGCLCNTVYSQGELSESVTGSASFPDLGITCIGNAAVFITSLLRGRLDLEMGARDVLATITGPKLNDIEGFGITTCREGEYKKASVVMLSTHTPNSSIKQFIKYMSSAHHVESILLHCVPFRYSEVPALRCECMDLCRCIIFFTVEEVTNLLALRMPKTLKRLSDSQCLLPCLHCLTKGCHGYNQELDLLHGEEPDEGLPEDLMHVEYRAAAVCEALNYTLWNSVHEERICICVPMHPSDDWTKVLIRSLKSKDKEERGVTVMASDALQKYMDRSGGTPFLETEEYNNISLIVPRLTEVAVNLILTGWFRVDGFSSSLVARRATRDYVVDSKGSGFAANTFLTRAMVKSNFNNTDVCQVLTFRGDLLGIRTLSLMVGSVNLICSVIWALLLVFEGGATKWYDHSMLAAGPRVAVMTAAILISLAMDCLDLLLVRLGDGYRWRVSLQKLHMLWVAIFLDITYIVVGAAVGGALGMKAFGRWIYSVMEGIVWVKWGIGSYLLGEYSIEYDNSRRSRESEGGFRRNWGSQGGVLVYTSSFLLNAILAGVRAKWRYRKAVAD